MMDLRHWGQTAWQDLRYGARQLRQAPGFTMVAVASLALGIGANTAIFQLVDAVRLRLLPVAKPEELVMVDFPRGSTRSGWFSSRSPRFTYTQWDQIRAQQQAFQGMMAWSPTRFNLARGGEVRYAEGMYVSGSFFPVLGVTPLMGTVFRPEDDQPNCGQPGVVISEPFWQRELGRDPSILGRVLHLDGQPFPIIGVTPANFFGVEVGSRYEVAIPLCAERLLASDKKGRIPIRHAWWLSIMGRLKPGWTRQSADAHLKAIAPSVMAASLPESYRPEQAQKYLANKLDGNAGGTGISGLRRQYETPLWLLLATTGLVLLIACANLANLLLARASIRERELAVRLAIGASRMRLVRQLLSESLLLAVSGAILGAVLAQALSRAMVAYLSTADRPLFVGLGVNGTVLAFTAALACTTCVLFGLLPALRATRMAPVTAMRTGGRSVTAGRERFGLRRALVVSQMALSLVLLVGALLFARSLRNLLTVEAGFQPEGILALEVDLRKLESTKERRYAVYRELQEHLSAQPGVVSAAQVAFTPISGSGWNQNVRADGKNSANIQANLNRVSPGYFSTMGTRLLFGRDFTDRDTYSAPKAAIVNEEFVRKVFNGENPVGRTFRTDTAAGKQEPVYQVVGMVRNTKYFELREEFTPIAFLPIAQDEDPGAGAAYVMRTRGPINEVMTHSKAAVAEVSPALDIEFRVFSTQLSESLARERLMASLSGAFGLLAGLLATMGLYGVIAYMVARRRNEIGVRMALGADRRRILWLVLKEAGVLLALGLVVGSMLSLWAGRAAATLLYGLQPHDPVTLAGAILLLAVVTLLASYWPARRAAGLEPMNALREE